MAAEERPDRPTRFYGVTTYSPNWSLSDLVRSDDGGATWEAVIKDGLAFGPIGPVVMDLGVHPQDPDTVIGLNYALDIGLPELPAAILRSTDGGVNWEELYKASIANYFSVFPFGIAIDRQNPDRMLVGVSRLPNGAPREAVILRTVDGGQTWSEADLGGDYWTTAIAFDAVDSQTAYASAWEWNTTNDDFFKTTDGGVTWTELPIPFACMNHLAADPRRSGHLYAGCDQVYRSTDGGATGAAVDEESFPDLRAVTWVSVSATSPRVLHAGTTQGVYSNTTGVELAVSGSCPGTVTFEVTNAPPNSEVGVVAAANNAGFVKQSGLCAGVEVEVSEPFAKPPTFVIVDPLANGSAQATVPANRCFFEALSFSNCTASGAQQVP